MAPTDPANTPGAEPALAGGVASQARGTSKRQKKAAAASRVGARVNVQGVSTLVTHFNSLLNVLRNVRREFDGINAAAARSPLGAGGAGPMGQGTSNPNAGQLAAMIGGAKQQFASSGYTKGLAAVGAATWGFNQITDRFNRNLNESIPISQGNMLIASQYGGQYATYGTMERARVAALGRFASSRGEALAAQGIALNFGQTAAQANTYLSQTVAPLVQASGGTMGVTQAAAAGGTFLDPFTQRRAMAMGIQTGKVGGQVQNPLNTAMGYIKNFEQRYGVRMNDIDFQNMRSPGSQTRYMFKRMYMLTDEAVDMIVQAGLQNVKFQGKNGNAGKTLNFADPKQLEQIGMGGNRLGMKAFELLSSQTRRESRFFQQQEGSMVGKLNTEITIQETLADVEDAFSSLLGPLGEFQKYLQVILGGSQMLLGAAAMGSFMRGGGGGLPLPIPGGGGGGGALGGMRGMMGAGLLIGGGMMAASAGSATGSSYGGLGGAGAIGGSAAMAGVGAFMLGGGPVGAGIAAVAAGGYAAKKYFDGKHARDVAKAMPDALTKSDKDLLATVPNYHGGWTGATGAGPKETARMDVLQMRRSALVASMVQELADAGVFSGLSGGKAAAIADIIANGGTADDKKFLMKIAGPYQSIVHPLIRTGGNDVQKVYRKYFGNLKTPFDFADPGTDESKALVLSANEIIGANSSTTGDASYDKGQGAKGATWDNLDPRMKSRLSSLFQASGGRVWLGNGWRSTQQQASLFFSRYEEDPNGDVEYNGKRYRHVRGAPAAPPNRSMHEVGLAADLEGDLAWVQANAGRFKLKTFAGVNNEPWHVQLSELPNSRREYEKGGGGSTSNGVTGSIAEGALSAGTASGGGGGGLGAQSGVNYNLAASSPAGVSSLMSTTAGSSTVGSLGGGASGGQLSITEVARIAYNAGWRGQDLINAVAIAMRESSGNASAFNGNTRTGDQSYGLWQINMLGSLGSSRMKQFGLSSYEDLLDPNVNARAAYALYSSGGGSFDPWGGYKGKSNTFNTDIAAAQAAVQSLGLGDGTFDKGGGGAVHISLGGLVVNLNAKGSVQYDAQQLADAALELIQEGAQMAVKRAS